MGWILDAFLVEVTSFLGSDGGFNFCILLEF